MKKLLAVLILTCACSLADTENHGTVGKGTQNNGGATVTVPHTVGLFASMPTTCVLGQTYYAQDKPAGSRVYGASVAGGPGVCVFTQEGGGGASCATIAPSTYVVLQVGCAIHFQVPRTALTAAAQTQELTFMTVPAKHLVETIRAWESTAFACAACASAITAINVSVGLAGSSTDNDVMLNWPLMQTVTNTNKNDQKVGYSSSVIQHDVAFLFTVSTGPGNFGNGTTTNLTAGVLDFWVTLTPLP